MKRAILLLVGIGIALILWDRFSASKSTPESSDETASTTNAAVAPTISSHSRAPVGPQHDFTNSISADEKEAGEEWKKLSREQVDAYLQKTKRSPESLLNAFEETGDTNFLAEAAERNPDNPVVQLSMLTQWDSISPEESARWLEKFKASSPDNVLPNYLSALDKFKSGNPAMALAEIDSASKKSLDLFQQERIQSREEMYLLLGYPAFDAKEQAMKQLWPNALPQMKQLSWEIDGLQQKYKSAGDNYSNEQLAIVGVETARKYYEEKNSPVLINQLVGYAMEYNAVKNLDASTYYDFLGKTAGKYIEEKRAERDEVRFLASVFPQLYSGLGQAEKIIYFDRVKVYGEANAMRWLQKNYASETK